MAKDEILIRLKSIEDKLDKGEKRAEGHRIHSSGIALMFFSLAVLSYNVWGCLELIHSGILLNDFPLL